jgi:ammonium transporter, Amt family
MSLDTGDTAWVLTSTALVLMMTMPGLALYYSGMVRTKNVLTTIMQSFTITCVITFLWLCFGYTLSFAPIEYKQPGEGYLIMVSL